MGIRIKVLLGFMILATMLFLAGAWSIYELKTVGTSVQGILDDNYRSINAARLMMDALEREDSATLLLLSGNWKDGREIIESADSSFQLAFEIAQKNVTIPGEKSYVEDIKNAYSKYKELWNRLVAETKGEKKLSWYFQKVRPAFLEVKLAGERLMALNDRVMYQTATDLKKRAHRAVMPGVVAILSALIFSFVFNYFVNYYLVNPIIKVTKAIQRFLETGEPIEVKIETKDEMHSLATSLQLLMTQSRKTEAV